MRVKILVSLSVSGDGIVHEVLNGLFERPDWREAMDSLPLGIVPAGSGNALARSIIHQQNELFNASSQVRVATKLRGDEFQLKGVGFIMSNKLSLGKCSLLRLNLRKFGKKLSHQIYFI